MALYTLLQQPDLCVVALLTTVTETYDRVAMHGVRRELLRRQAESIGLPLHEVFIPQQCVNPIYEARMEEALRIHYAQASTTLKAFAKWPSATSSLKISAPTARKTSLASA